MMSESEPTTPKPGGNPERREQPSIELWLVEDRDDITRMWRSFIENMPHVTLRRFEKGEEAIAEFRRRLESTESLPHGIVMDGNLDKDTAEEFKKGASLIASIRSLTKDAPKQPIIIAHSGVGSDNDAMKSAGADIVLAKPARYALVLEAIKKVEEHSKQ